MRVELSWFSSESVQKLLEIVLLAFLSTCWFAMAAQEAQAKVSSNFDDGLDSLLHATMRATDSETLRRTVAELRQLTSSRAQCKIELKSKRIPVDCYRVLKQEALQAVLTSLQQRKQIKLLDKVCLERSKAESSIEVLAEIESKGQISAQCRHSVDDRLLDLRYQSELTAPDVLFETRETYGTVFE